MTKTKLLLSKQLIWFQFDFIVISMAIGNWNIRRLALSGQISLLNRYFNLLVEEATRQCDQLRLQGQNVTQWISINDMKEFTLRDQGCLACI